MSNVKPATDDEIVTIKSDPKFSITEEYPCTFAECLRLIARIESDRAEIARLKAAHERDMCADGHERIRYTPAEDFGTCPLCVLRADNSTQSRLLTLKDGEIASLKAEVERLSACHACEGIGTIFVHVGVSTTITRGVQCLCCNGTGRAR